MPHASWPFEQPPDTQVITLRSIILRGNPILRVTHDLDDGWQFLSLNNADASDAAIVRLGDILARDLSIVPLASLPPGWHAYRTSPDTPWTTEPDPQAHD